MGIKEVGNWMERNKVGTKLSGMGAWFSGQGPQYEANRASADYYRQLTKNQEEEAEQRRRAEFLENEEMRRQMLIDDARSARGLIDRGRPDLAATLLEDRVAVGEQAGLDMRDTRRGLEMIQSGDTGAFMEATGALIQEWDERQAAAQAASASDPLFSPKTEMLPGGLAVMSNNAGDLIVKTVDGRVLRGQEASEAVERARRMGAEEQGLRAGERAAGAQAVELSGKMFEQLEGVQSSIRLLEQAEVALDRGAQTGPIMSRLPTVTDASAALDQVQRQLGLNVLQNTTFGALSKEEMRFALETALPQNLRPDELREWVRRKREAQQKLSYYLSEAAFFLGRPGNTVADFMQMKKEQSEQNTFTWGELTGGQQ